jgi:hypothetical protein
MPTKPISILATRETIFFSYQAGQLCQWLMVTIANETDQTFAGQVTVASEAGPGPVVTALNLAPGINDYRCYAPLLWPNHTAPAEAQVKLALADQAEAISLTGSIGTYRPWTIYLLSDVCTDYTWVYADEATSRAHDAAITAAELALAEVEPAGGLEANRNHYNFVHAREAEFFLEHYPHQAEAFFNHIRQGTITLNPFFNMAMTGNMSLEELIRQFYPARGWAMQHGLEIGYANHQETPTITWAMATILAQSGIRHLVKSILPYECPWAARLAEPPLFIWEGPDGSQVLLRRRNNDYVEGNFVLRDLRATTMALHEEIIPRYQQLQEQYPFSAIALVGCYGDLSPHSHELPAKKAATIAAYNAQGWAFPRLVNASHQQFWDDIEAQMKERQLKLPVYRGDYGTAWEAWTLSLAYDFAGWRRAQERAGTADKLAAIMAGLDRAWYDNRQARLAQGWLNLTYLADHAWNGANDDNRALNAALRRRWQEAANRAFDQVITEGLAALGRHIPTAAAKQVLVFNGLGWPRSGLIRLDGADPGVDQPVDLASGEALPCQVGQEAGQPVLYVEARDVPALGYRVLALQQPAAPQATPDWHPRPYRLESPFYALEVSPITGAITRLYDKTRRRELIDLTSPYQLNQCLYLSDSLEHTPQQATIEPGPAGPIFGQLVARARLKHIELTSTITLYANLDRVDICNELRKVPSTERHEVSFIFPLAVPDRHYRVETPGAIITPGADQLPGAGQAVTATRHFVDIFNDEFGLTFAQADSGLVQFGHRTSLEDPLEPEPGNSTLLALALGNNINWREVTRDQAGAANFTFRYSLRGHAGGFNPVEALRFAWENNNELLATPLAGRQSGQLPPHRHSFGEVAPDNVVLFALKVAEEEGLIARLWECAGRETTAQLNLAGLGRLRAANPTDLLERNDGPALAVNAGQVNIPLPKQGLVAARLQFE